MKNIFKKFSVFAVGLLFIGPACTNLDEVVYSEVTADNFFQTDEEFIAALGDAYTRLYSIGNHSNNWSMNEIASDELIIATKGGDWFDGGILQQLHKHEIAVDNDFVNNTWTNSYGGISTCNRLIKQFTALEEAGNTSAAAFIAELRGLRALYFYWLLDAYGNVPLSIDFDDVEPKGNNSDFQTGRNEVYAFVESELNEIIPLLDANVGGAAYGRFNRAAGHHLRSKLYLNAEVFSGGAVTDKYDDAIVDADAVMAFGYALESNYSDNFRTDNAGSSENIFVVPYDKVFAGGFNWAPMTLHYASQGTFNFTFQPWNGYAVVEEFYNSYVDPAQNPGPQGPVWTGLAPFVEGAEVPNDIGTQDARISNFIVGPQFNSDGTPTIDPAFEGETATSPDPDGTRLNFTPESNELGPNGWRQGGARIGKYQFELGTTENISNDFVIFRAADALLTKAEAQYRTGNTAGALTIINQIRARAGVDPLTDLDAPPSFNPTGADIPGGEILNERGREMFAELTRRQDLIRFGVWGEPWWEKPASPSTDEVFPIPQPQIDVNALLNQNPGY